MNKRLVHWLERDGLGNIVCICTGSLVMMLPSLVGNVPWVIHMCVQVLAMQILSFFLPSYVVFLSVGLWIVCGLATELPIVMGRDGCGVITGLRAGYFWGFMCAGPLVSMLYRMWRKNHPSSVAFVLGNVCGQIILLVFGWLFIACHMGAIDAWIFGFRPFVFTLMPLGIITATGIVACDFFLGTHTE